MDSPITENRVRAQAWKYYFVLLAWPAASGKPGTYQGGEQ